MNRHGLARVKQVALTLLTRSGLPALSRRLSPRRTTIFMLHRFAEPRSNIAGHDPAWLKRDLEYLRREDYQILGVEEALRRHAEGDGTLRNAVCFTVDDGYEDFATLAAPVFSAFDCPVTVFLITGFLDGETWPWWDQLEHVFRTTSLRRLELGSTGDVYAWKEDSEKRQVLEGLVEHCKTISNAEKWEVIAEVAGRLEVAVPDRPPPDYSPLTWDQVRALDGTGLFRFGPHTVTHPILSKVPDEQAKWEIVESRARVEAETYATSPVFCYPNGDPSSFGAREIDVLAERGFIGAVTSVHGYVSDRNLTGPKAAYTLPRFPYPGDRPRFVEAVAGMRRFRAGFEDVALSLPATEPSTPGGDR